MTLSRFTDAEIFREAARRAERKAIEKPKKLSKKQTDEQLQDMYRQKLFNWNKRKLEKQAQEN